MNTGFHCTGQMADGDVWRRVGERFADVNVVDRVAHGGTGVMVWLLEPLHMSKQQSGVLLLNKSVFLSELVK